MSAKVMELMNVSVKCQAKLNLIHGMYWSMCWLQCDCNVFVYIRTHSVSSLILATTLFPLIYVPTRPTRKYIHKYMSLSVESLLFLCDSFRNWQTRMSSHQRQQQQQKTLIVNRVLNLITICLLLPICRSISAMKKQKKERLQWN